MDSPGTLHHVIVRRIEKKDIAYDKRDGVSVEALKGGSRRGRLPGLRVQSAKELVKNLGITMAETARQLGVTTFAILRIFERKK